MDNDTEINTGHRVQAAGSGSTRVQIGNSQTEMPLNELLQEIWETYRKVTRQERTNNGR